MSSALLVMAYGTPRDVHDIERYYTDIRHGRPPTPELLAELTARYRAIGGRSPLLEITQAQVKGIEDRLGGIRAYLGQKHSPPDIPEAVAQIAENGADRIVGLVLAPHYSVMSVGDYENRVRRAAEQLGWPGTIEMVRNWHLEPGYIAFLRDAVEEALGRLPDDVRDEAVVVFSAHSLPERILEEDDPYPAQLRETAEAVAEGLGLGRWRTGWQSAGRSGDAWLGPDILEILQEEARAGTTALICCPCGFVADHLEVLYDLDVEAAAAATREGIAFARTRSPNTDPGFLDAVASAAKRRLAVTG